MLIATGKVCALGGVVHVPKSWEREATEKKDQAAEHGHGGRCIPMHYRGLCA